MSCSEYPCAGRLRPRGPSGVRSPLTRFLPALMVVAVSTVVGCTDESPVVPDAPREIPMARATVGSTGSIGQIDDLKLTFRTDQGMTVRWTQVGDGAGGSASYRVRYSRPSIDFPSAQQACQLRGREIGTGMFCYIGGLKPGTRYDVQVAAYRVVDGDWSGARRSNIISPSTRLAPGEVNDLMVTTIRKGALTVRWRQVGDGGGNPARYNVRVSAPPIDFDDARVACDEKGTAIGDYMWCYVGGLRPGRTYDVHLAAYRRTDGKWVASTRSNIVTATTADDRTWSYRSQGIWLSRSQISSIRTSGDEWALLVADATKNPGVADISNQDSNHDVLTLAAALVCARSEAYCDKALDGVMSARGTEAGATWLEVGRNLGAYIIAADLIGLHADADPDSPGSRFERWVESWLTKRLPDHVSGELRPFRPFGSAGNASAEEGFAFTAVAAYLGRATPLKQAWNAYRAFACDPSATLLTNLRGIVEDGWTLSTTPCPINPKGSTRIVPLSRPGGGSVHRLDGSLGGDMRRGGKYQWEPRYTHYPWVGLEGFIPAAVLLQRAGYQAFAVSDRAALRTHQYLWYLRRNTGDQRWFDGVRSREVITLVNVAYGMSFPINALVGAGRTMGYTAWSHPEPTMLGLSSALN